MFFCAEIINMQLHVDYLLHRQHCSSDIGKNREQSAVPAAPSQSYLGSLDVCRGDSGINFPTLCLCRNECGSVHIWVSCSFMHCSYSGYSIQTCLSFLQCAAHSRFDVGNCAGEHIRGKEGVFKNSIWQATISIFLVLAFPPIKSIGHLKHEL